MENQPIVDDFPGETTSFPQTDVSLQEEVHGTSQLLEKYM